MAELKGPTTVGGNEVLRYRYGDFLINPAANTTSGSGAVVVSNSTYSYSFGYISDGQIWSDASWNPTTPTMQGANYGYVVGGFNDYPAAGRLNVIQKYDLASQNPGSDVGDLTSPISYLAGTNSYTHGYAIGGYNPPGPLLTTRNKFPFSSDTNASLIPDFSPVGRFSHYGVSSTTSGYVMGGYTAVPPLIRTDEIIRFPFTSENTLVDVGELSTIVSGLIGQASFTHGYGSGGFSGSSHTTAIKKFPFTSDTSAADIGNLSWGCTSGEGNSSDTTGYALGGTNPTAPYFPGRIRSVSSFSFSSDINGTEVGTLATLQSGYGMASANSPTEGFTSGGEPGTDQNSIFKFPFAGPSNTSDSVRDLIASTGFGAGAQV